MIPSLGSINLLEAHRTQKNTSEITGSLSKALTQEQADEREAQGKVWGGKDGSLPALSYHPSLPTSPCVLNLKTLGTSPFWVFTEASLYRHD